MATTTLVQRYCPCGCGELEIVEEGQRMTAAEERQLYEHYKQQYAALPPDKRPFAKARQQGVRLSLDTATGKVSVNRPRTPEDIEALLMAAAYGQGSPQVRMSLLAEEDYERAQAEKAAGCWTDQTPEPSAKRVEEILAEFAANTGADVGAPASARMSITAAQEQARDAEALQAGPWGERGSNNWFAWPDEVSPQRAREIENALMGNVESGADLA
jgi:hypothetical protein